MVIIYIYTYIYISHLNGKSLQIDDIPHLKYFTTHTSLDVVRQIWGCSLPQIFPKPSPQFPSAWHSTAYNGNNMDDFSIQSASAVDYCML